MNNYKNKLTRNINQMFSSLQFITIALILLTGILYCDATKSSKRKPHHIIRHNQEDYNLIKSTNSFAGRSFEKAHPVPLVRSGTIQLNLDGAGKSGIWTAQGQNGTRDIIVPASVPGGIYSDLEASGVLKSKIYHDYNDMESRWVGRTDWSFYRNFTVTEALLSKSKVLLICEGLDTVSEVFINDVLVGKSRNMFVRYVFEIKSTLEEGINEIRIEFQSPVEYAKNEMLRYKEIVNYPIYPLEMPKEYRGVNHANMIRKMQSSFSWDWGPAYPSSGIWKSIYIEGLDGAVIRDVLIFNSPNKPIPDETSSTKWNLTARVYFALAVGNDKGLLSIKQVGSGHASKIPVVFEIANSKTSDQFKDITIVVPGNEAKLWWPNGYGKQPLYAYEITYKSEHVHVASSKTIRVGFRTVGLVQEFVNSSKPDWGREFYFKVNGIPIYSKGSNTIPIHVLPEKVTPEMTRWLLESAREINTNMVRVWGGGIYESDLFFHIADELGILIWEDFMFACALYPATPDFLENVQEEVQTQVKRLQRHPSLAIWAANNENESALRGNWWPTSYYFENYTEDFIKLYIDTIRSEVKKLDHSRSCLSSSPTNGIESEKEGWIADNPSDLHFGDAHPYDYSMDNWDWTMFKRTRFASEYGYQSFPYIGSLDKITTNLKEWTWESEMLTHRQHHPRGQSEIQHFIKSHLPLPKDYNSVRALPSMLYMAQVTQSMGQKTQTESYRRLVDKLDLEDGTGHNMGALYWQLNDIWPGASWASIENTGRWKMFAYYAKRAFAPILPSIYRDTDGNVVVELISDILEEFKGVMRVRIVRLDSLTPLTDYTVPVNAKFLTSKEVHSISFKRLKELKCHMNAAISSRPPCIVLTSLPGAPDNFLFLQYPTNRQFLANPNLKISDARASANEKTISFTLSANEVAPFVFLNLKDQTFGWFDDNGFIMADASRNGTYTSKDPISVSEFMDQIRIESLYDVTIT